MGIVPTTFLNLWTNKIQNSYYYIIVILDSLKEMKKKINK